MSDRGTKRPLIVPIFIPHQGCPYRCIYCQQEKITAQPLQPVNKLTIQRTLDEAVNSPGFDRRREREVAFYGGTFTRLDTARITELLEPVRPYLKRGFFRSIRVSTRPDAMDREKLDLMSSFGVTTIELGTQSMDDRVLALSRRGHTAQDTVESVKMLKECGFRVGIQLMPGLPGDSEEKFMKTVDEVVKLRPHMVRLYPAVVIRGTILAQWYAEKRYEPWSLERAVKICQESCVRLEGHGIPVIRIGLMSSPTLLREGEVVAGPWHDAFGFLVRSSIHQEKIMSFLPEQGAGEKIRLRAPHREIPLVRGYRNLGLRMMEGRSGVRIVDVIADGSIPPGQIGVDVLGR